MMSNSMPTPGLPYPQQQTMTWKELHLKQELQQALHKFQFPSPSPIQTKALPKIITGHNVICQSKAGTGKTAVFVLGILQRMTVRNNEYLGHQCLVIANTRELAYQINMEFRRFCEFFRVPRIRVGCYFGGLPIERDIEELGSPTQCPHIIIGTPGRILDLFRRGMINGSNVQYFVLDECDVTLSPGEEGMLQEMTTIHSALLPNTQHIMVSATISPLIRDTCRQLCPSLTEVFMDDGQLNLSDLSQFYEIVSETHKFELLQDILDSTPFNQAIIFVNTVEKTWEVAQALKSILFNPISLHSDLRQEERLENYRKFKNQGAKVLVATDLIGRGIDIEEVNLVVNYDCPREMESYVHRIGRAGRFNSRGVVINFISQNYQMKEMALLQDVMDQTDSSIGRLPESHALGLYIRS